MESCISMEKQSNNLSAISFHYRAMVRKRTMCSGPEGDNRGRLVDAIFRSPWKEKNKTKQYRAER